jgi:hypothetical protein
MVSKLDWQWRIHQGQIWPKVVPGKSFYAVSAELNQKSNRQQIWQLFFAWSVIASRQGSATCFQILVVKNINSNHRINGVHSQYGLSAALTASQAAGKAKLAK